MSEISNRRGPIMSCIALVAMGSLFFLETKAYFSTSLSTNMALDSNEDRQIQLNLDITMLDLPCKYATLDLFSDLGNWLNITDNIQKLHVDGEGRRQALEHRNWHQNDIELWDPAVTESVEDLHADGEDAISVDGIVLNMARHQFPFVFVNYFHGQECGHCRDFAPTWEVVGESVTHTAMAKVDEDMRRNGVKDHLISDEEYEVAVNEAAPVLIAKIDCGKYPKVCVKEGIRAYPTLRAFVNGKAKGDYNGHRTVVEIVDWISEVENATLATNAEAMKVVKAHAAKRTVRNEEEAQWAETVSRNRAPMPWNEADHPGCRLSGHVMVDRAPGNFHIQAQSYGHDLAAHMTNVSHIVHHLSFGNPSVQKYVEEGRAFSPPGFEDLMHPMDGNLYVTGGLHQAHHHYLKVVTTEFDAGGDLSFGSSKKRSSSMLHRAYRILQSSQVSLYSHEVVPEAKFSYDLSPIAISYRRDTRHWYDYLTGVMAIIGGTFTVIGMMDSGLASFSSSRRKQYF